jgi:UDP-glucose 4-epimerase
MANVLVTGGAGYIGSHVALALCDAGERVVVLDNLSGGPPAARNSDAIFVEGAIEDSALVSDLIKEHRIESIFHLAAFIAVEESMQEPDKYFKNNTENTGALLKTAKENGVQHFIFSSTAAVYGNPKKMPISEDDPTNPINPYGDSKLRAEKLVQECGIRAVMLRYFNVAGADPDLRAGYRVDEEHTHLIRRAVAAVLNESTLTIFGTDYPTPDGTCVRDYVHVSDLAAAHIRALEHLRKNGQKRIYNYGYGHGHSVAEVVEAVGRVSQKEINVQYGKRRAGDPAILVADPSRIKKELGIKPKYDDLDTIISHELAWVRSQLK